MSAEHVRSDWVEIPAGKWGRVPSSEIENRIARAQAGLARAGIELALVVQNADLYYLTGTIQQGQLLLPAQGEPVLLVRKDLNRARQESPLPRVKAISSLRELPGAVAAMGMSEAFVLGMELDVLPVNVFRRYEALFPKAVVRDVSPVIREVRTVKSEYERALMAEAAAMVDSVVQTVAGILREGMTEVELSAHCEFALRAAGYQGLARYRAFNQEWSYSHVFSGPSAALPAFADTPLGGPGVSPAIGQGAGWRPIQRGEPVVIDMVGSAGGYLVDQTRILSIGPLPEDMVQGYEICLGAQEVLKQVAVPGATCGAVYQQVKDWVEQKVQELGLTAYFMGAPGNQVPYIGHGIGLELDEFPFITRGSEQTLAADQVFACEPKLVFPGRGVVGVENTWHVTEQGLVPITFSSEALRVV